MTNRSQQTNLSFLSPEGSRSMGRKLIVGYNGTAPARDALALARRLVFATGADMILANVYPGHLYADVGKGDDQSYFNIMKRNAERVLAEAPTGVHAELRAVAASSPAHGLHDLATETDAEFVVLGSTHRSKLGLIEPGSTGNGCCTARPALSLLPRSDTRSTQRIAQAPSSWAATALPNRRWPSKPGSSSLVGSTPRCASSPRSSLLVRSLISSPGRK